MKMEQYHHDLSSEQISKAIFHLNIEFINENDVNLFLSQRDLFKNNSKRLFAYLISLKIIPVNHIEWADEIVRRYNQFHDLLETHFNGYMNDPFKLRPNIKRVVTGDLERTGRWYSTLAEELNLSNQFDIIPLSRIVVLKSIMDFSYEYLQGHDRYLIISYLLCLYFCSTESLPMKLADALTYFLFDKFVELAKIQRYLNDTSYTQKFFHQIDLSVKENCPDLAFQISKNNHSSIHYALSWHILFFADIYKIRDLLLLWDHIILHQNNLSEYLISLTISHLKQIPNSISAPHEYPILESIQKYRNYNINLILTDADNLSRKRNPLKIGAIILVVILLIILLFSISK